MTQQHILLTQQHILFMEWILTLYQQHILFTQQHILLDNKNKNIKMAPIKTKLKLNRLDAFYGETLYIDNILDQYKSGILNYRETLILIDEYQTKTFLIFKMI